MSSAPFEALCTLMKVRTGPLVWHDALVRLVYDRRVDPHAPPTITISRAVFFGSDKEIVLDPQLQRVQLLRRSERDIRRRRFSIAYGFRKKLVRFRAPDAATYEKWYAWLQFALRRFKLYQLRMAKRRRSIGELGGKSESLSTCQGLVDQVRPVAATERASCASTVDNDGLTGSISSSDSQDDVQFGTAEAKRDPEPAVSQLALANKTWRRDLLLLYAPSDLSLKARRKPHCMPTLETAYNC